MLDGHRSHVGELLRHWRQTRRMSQLELALDAEVSARHISFVETGRSAPSREMVLVLSSALSVPLRERNALLQAAGYAPVYRETPFGGPEMADVRRAVELILRQHGPLGGAVALDRHWDVLMGNLAFARLIALLLGPGSTAPLPFEVTQPPRPNLLRMLFGGLRPHIVNWEEVAGRLVSRVRREIAWTQDPISRDLLAEVLQGPGIPAHLHESDLESPTSLVHPIELRVGTETMRIFSTITTLGTPQDITLQELRIESYHAADAQSDRLVCALLEG